VRVPSLGAALHTGPPFWEHQAALVAAAVADLDAQTALVLVGHSGAGPLLPLIAQRLPHAPAGFVYVDAGLPRRGAWLDSAPGELARELEAAAIDGKLPPWTEWWDPADLEAELPDPSQRAAVASQLEPLPLAMFTEERPEPPRWRDRPSTYLLLSAGYTDEAEHARGLGWATDTLECGHLGLLTQPADVAARIGSLIEHLTERGTP
jgi:hypothetical protein